MAQQLNHSQVMEILPHRSPMLLIDEVQELCPGESIRASFHVEESREIFQGHFPGNPLLPGVYTVEVCAQATDLMLMTKPAYAGKLPLFLGIDKVKFKKMVRPGDTLDIRGELLSQREEKAIGTCRCQVYTQGELAAEAEITIAMR